MMKKEQAILVCMIMISCAAAIAVTQRRTEAVGAIATPGGYVIERDAQVAKDEPGPHKGTGRSTGYIFFDKVPDLKFSFRKRVLHPGASIGHHLQETDKVYYVLSGMGKMTIDGREFSVKPGDAILTRGGSSHGLVQTGDGDLTIVITFQK